MVCGSESLRLLAGRILGENGVFRANSLRDKSNFFFVTEVLVLLDGERETKEEASIHHVMP